MPYITYDPAIMEPFDGLLAQLVEFRGLVKTVPRLIEEDRDRRRQENRPGDGALGWSQWEKDAGEEEGWGHADFARYIRGSVLSLAWEYFQDCLVREGMQVEPSMNRGTDGDEARQRRWFQLFRGESQQSREQEEELRDFRSIRRWYRNDLHVPLEDLPKWSELEQIRLTRHAFVHNLGRYSEQYVRGPLPQAPRIEDFPGSYQPGEEVGNFDWEDLVDEVLLPLSEDLVLFYLETIDESSVLIRTRLSAVWA